MGTTTKTKQKATTTKKVQRTTLAFSVLSGLFAALSGFLGKVTFDPGLVIAVSILNVRALIGFLAFGERLSLIWWSGTSMILLGTYIISSSEQHTPTGQHGRNKLD